MLELGRRPALLGLLATALLGAVALASMVMGEPPQKQKPLEATRLATETTWQGPQYVGADNKGRIFILRVKEQLEVYPLEKDGSLGEPEVLATSPFAEPAPVLDAAMDEHGDWILIQGNEPRLFRSGKEKPLPLLNWMISSVALLNGEPVASSYPIPVGRVDRRDVENPPLLVSLGSDGWDTVVASETEGPPDMRKRMALRQENASKLLADSRNTLWLAFQYRYRLVHYSRAGRELLVVEADGAKVRHREEGEVETARTQLEEERARYSEPERTSISTNTARQVILDLAEGRDGRIYLLTRAGEEGGLTLDRFDPVMGVLERTPLAVSTPGQVSVASGRDGLYLIPFNGKEKRYFISWEAMEVGDWGEVEGVEMNGMEIESFQGRRES